jgi:serine protein kinase
MWAILTRLEEPKKAGLTRMQKLKLYNGKSMPGFTEDSIKELRERGAARRHGWHQPAVHAGQNLQRAVSRSGDREKHQPLHGDERVGAHGSAITADHDEEPRRVSRPASRGEEEYEDILKSEVQRAISADEDAISRLCANYIDNVRAYTQKEKVQKRYTGQYEEPDERLMRSIEEKIDIPESARTTSARRS